MKTIFNQVTVSLVMTSIISILLGVFYITEIISFDFSASKAGSEREWVNLWGMISSGMGVIVLVSCLSLKYGKRRMIKTFLVGVLIFLFMLQAPPILLWSIFGSSGHIKEFIFVLSMHVILVVTIVRTLIIATR
ncbi:hypothetical protein AMS62_20110 [Bacillus sp. FJAT-18019]|nr:hypothetical protein AMS62_20110 [Bacillus sp. FJAT-18019]